MRLLHFLEIENFKRFGPKQRIALDHPTVLVGPNNCGKTSAVQALALWSLAVKTWYDLRHGASPKERGSTALNRLGITSIPIERTRLLWHNTAVRAGKKEIPIIITAGIEFEGKVVSLPMRFRNQGEDLIYCAPDGPAADNLALLKHAASIGVEILHPVSGMETEEAVLMPGRIKVLLGQGQTGQVLRNLCLQLAADAPDDWQQVTHLMQRLFQVTLNAPYATARGAIDLRYRQPGAAGALDLSSAGRGFQQLLALFTHLYLHKNSVLLLDEPDAHLEILRQKQAYVLLRDIASANGSQVVLVTHSDVILDEALPHNLTLLLAGAADDLARKPAILNSLKLFGAAHYVKARERGYVLYAEGGSDVDMLRAMAERLGHRAATLWDERINSFYVQDDYSNVTQDSELARVEGGFGITPRDHFKGLQAMLPDLKGLAILDSDGKGNQDRVEGALTLTYWQRYEAENYFVTPDLLRAYARSQLAEDLWGRIDSVLDALVLEQVFASAERDFNIWKALPADAAGLLWEAKTERTKLSAFAEQFFRRLRDSGCGRMLLTKGELHRLVPLANPAAIPLEVTQKLDLLADIFFAASVGDGT